MSRVLSAGAIRELLARTEQEAERARVREAQRQRRAELYRGGRPRLAVDVTISQRAFPLLAAAGADVVFEAATGEPDEVWFAAALRAGIHVVASADRDLNRLCYEAGARWLRLPGSQPGFRWREQADFVIRKLRRWRWIP